MNSFRKLTDDFYASPQIEAADMAAAKALGITLIVNNRPDGEEAGQPDSAQIAAAAKDAGLDYIAIPITPAGFNRAQIEALREALAEAEGPVLGFCRSGTRSTFLWSLAQAANGVAPDAIAARANAAGYDISPLRPTIEALSAAG